MDIGRRTTLLAGLLGTIATLSRLTQLGLDLQRNDLRDGLMFEVSRCHRVDNGMATPVDVVTRPARPPFGRVP